MRKKVNIAFSLLFILVLGWGQVFAGTTGKLRGFVKDAQTGEALPGVNVLISKVWTAEGRVLDFEESIGAATDLSGEYIILNVPPGLYSVTASMMGYSPQTQEKVRVSVDRTMFLDFKLQQTVLDVGGEIVVQAERDLVRLDVAATESYITPEQYTATPFANRIEDVIGLQSGISGNIVEGEMKIREGNTHEIGFLLDGMEVVDKKFNRPVIAIQPGSVQEIKVMRNGFNAEYGQSRSGVINVITKDPSDRFHVAVDYQWTPPQKPHYGRNKYDPNWRWEWRLLAGPNAFEGGELTVPDGLRDYTYSWIGWNKFSENLLKDKNPDNDLTPEEAFELWKWRHRALEYGNESGHNVDVTFSGKVPLIPWRMNFLLGGKYEMRPFDYPQSRDYYDEKISSLKLVNNLGANIRLTLNGMYSEVKSITQGSSTSEWSEEDRISYTGSRFTNYYPFEYPVIDRYSSLAGAKWVHTLSPKMYYEVNLSHFYIKWGVGRPDSARAEDGRYFHGRLYYDPQSGWIPKERGVDDNASGYRMHGGALTWDDSWNRRYALNSVLTYQFHPAHELKTGIDANFNTLRENRTHWHNEDSTQAYTRDYKVNPIEFAVFAQDKIEFQGMVANIGLRFDYFDVNGRRPDPHQALTYRTDREIYESFVSGTYPTFRPKAKYYLSPRLGISHPLSERSKIYFNYGHFIQTPKTEVLYHTIVDNARPRLQVLGNADINFPIVISYELGCDIGLSDFFQLHLGAFYKDYSDYESGMVYAHSDQSLVMEWYDQNNYMEIRGLEIELRKSIGRFITGWINYNYIKKSEANLEIPNLSQIPIVTDDPNIGRNGVLWGVPRSNIPEIQPYARGVITLSAPEGWGPRLWNYSILGNTMLSTQVYYQGGGSRTHPNSGFRNQHPDVRFYELDRYWTNMRLSRLFRYNKSSLEFYVDASSILHTKFRNPPGGQSGEDYFNDLWDSGRLREVGTDKLSNPRILRTESDDVYWARHKTFVLGLRLML